MDNTFSQLMEAYVKCHLESEQGQSAMKYAMASYIHQNSIRRLKNFKDNATDPFSFLYHPYEQIETLLMQCSTVSSLLQQCSNHLVPDYLSTAVLGIHECCTFLNVYVSVAKFDETALTKTVDQIIQSNHALLAQASQKPRTMTREEFLSLADEPEYYEPYSGPERSDESKLRAHGYSVAQNSSMSDTARQELLRSLIAKRVVSKGYVISYLKHLIQINGRKESNYIALKKWESDLQYVLKL